MLLKGKKGLIMGLANDKSIAWGIAKKVKEAGAELAISYQGEVLKKRVEPLAKELGVDTLIECDVTNTEQMQGAFNKLRSKFGKLDFLVHAIAYSDKNELKGKITNATRENFLNSMNISCFSFIEVCKLASEMMNEGGSIVTMTYYGAQKAIPNYNVMGIVKAALEASTRYLARDLGPQGIRVNAISAGPIKTLAAAGISDFKYMIDINRKTSALKRNVTIEDVGSSALYLLSDLSNAVTGEVHFVDCGYSIIGLQDQPEQHKDEE